MRLSGTKTGSANQYNGLGDQLYDLGGARPTLDLNFASNESLVDSVTGKTLVDHTRASSGTYVDGDGVIKKATTNLLLWSEEFDTWSPTGVTVTANQVTAPDGSTTADLIEATATAAYSGRVTSVVSGVVTKNYSISVYAKAGNSNFIAIGFVDSGFGNVRGYFDLSTGASSSNSTAWTVSDTDIQGVGNGWYRCTVRFDVVQTDGSADVQIYPTDNLSTNNVTSGNSVYIWGAQLEASPYATSYIPTAGSQVTRAADVSDGGANTFGNSWYRQDEGTMFVDFLTGFDREAAANWNYMSASDGSTNNVIGIRGGGGATSRRNVYIRSFVSGAVEAEALAQSNIEINTRYRIAGGYALSNFAASSNGSPVGIDTSALLPSGLNQMSLAGGVGSIPTGRYCRITYWPQRLPNDTLQTITL